MKTNLLSLVRAVANSRMSQMTELAKYLDAMIDWDRISNPDDSAKIHSLVDAGTLIPNKIFLLDDGTAELGCHFVDDYTETLRLNSLGKIEWDTDRYQPPFNKHTSDFVAGLDGSYDPVQTFTRLANALRRGNPTKDPCYYDVVEVSMDSAQEWENLRDRVRGWYFGHVWIPMHANWVPNPEIKIPAAAWYYRPQTTILPRRLSAIVFASQAVMRAPSFMTQAVMQLWKESEDPEQALSWFEKLTDFVPTDTLVLDETRGDRYTYSAIPDMISAVFVTLGLKEDEVNELLG